MPKTNVVTVRIEAPELESLQALAVVDKATLAHEIREAVNRYVDSRTSEAKFRDALKAAKERHVALLDVLEKRIQSE